MMQDKISADSGTVTGLHDYFFLFRQVTLLKAAV
jgi:hypothetical protein